MSKTQNNSKLSNSWQSSSRLENSDFGHWKIISDFEIRISYFLAWILPRRFARPEPLRAEKAQLR